MQCEIAILAGGSSTRMGQDKASIVWQQRTVLETIAAEALKTGSLVTVVGRSAPGAWSLEGIPFVLDRVGGMGPLGGLRTALEVCESEAVLALACDLPLITAEAIEWLLDRAERAEYIGDGVAVRNEAQLEPLFSVYTRSCIPQIEGMLSNGSKALYRLVLKGDFEYADIPAHLSPQLRNFNTPEDWEALRWQG